MCFFVEAEGLLVKGEKGVCCHFLLSCKHQTWSCRADLPPVPSGKTKKLSSILFLSYSYVQGMTTRPDAGAWSLACQVLAQRGKEKKSHRKQQK